MYFYGNCFSIRDILTGQLKYLPMRKRYATTARYCLLPEPVVKTSFVTLVQNK